MQPVCQLTLVGVGACAQLLLLPLSVTEVAGIPSHENREGVGDGAAAPHQRQPQGHLSLPCSPPTSHFRLFARDSAAPHPTAEDGKG